MRAIIIFIIATFFLSSCSKKTSEITYKTLEFTGDITSCSDFILAQNLSQNEKKVTLEISGYNRESLQITEKYKTFILPHKDINISISKWEKEGMGYYCEDIIYEDPVLIDKYNLISGNIKIKATDVEKLGRETYYNISLILENAVLQNSKGDKVKIESHEMLNHFIGWFPG